MMLDAHPDLAIPPETHFIPWLGRIWDEAAHPHDAVIEALVGHPRWPDFNIDADRFRARLASVSASTLADVLRMFYSMYAEEHGKRRWGDKTPRYVLDMPMIAELFPEAHFIHIIRDGRDAALSVLPLWFGPRSVEEAAVWWKERIEVGRRAGRTLPYTEVRYEDLVVNVQPELQRLCGILDLDFRREMLTSHTRASERLSEEKDLPTSGGISAGRRTQIHARVRFAPDARSIGRWRTEMTSRERQRFEELAGDTLERLGYPVG